MTLEGQGFVGEPIEADPFGGNVGTQTPYVANPDPDPTPNEDFPAFEVGNYEWGAVNGQRVTYNVDGLWVMFPIGLTMQNNPNVQCPDNDCNPRTHEENGHVSITSPFLARNDGSTGYMELVGTSVTIDGETGPTEYSWGFVKIDDGGLDKLQDKQSECDTRLARIFGDDDAVVGTVREPATLTHTNGSPLSIANASRNFRSERVQDGVMHLYASPTGLGQKDGFAFTPPGYSGKPDTITAVNTKSLEPEVQSNYIFKYLPGSLSKYGYEGSLRINFVHSGTTDEKGNLLPVDPTVTNSMGSIKVGVIGNFGINFSTGGNSDGEFVHDHVLFNILTKKGGKGAPIDPRKVFCHDLGF